LKRTGLLEARPRLRSPTTSGVASIHDVDVPASVAALDVGIMLTGLGTLELSGP
jgi:hypothetical protein